MTAAEFITNITDNRYQLIVGVALAASCSILSVFVVLRKMAMISEAVAHSGIGGIAIALLIGYFITSFNDPLILQVITGIFCLVTALIIGYVSKGKHVSEDSAIGIFLVTSVAMGIFLLSVRRHLPMRVLPAGAPTPPRVASIESILFGDINSVQPIDAWIAVGTLVVVAGIVIAFYNEMVYTSLDMEMARINGVRTNLINTLLLCMIALVIVVGSRMAGALMITAMMVIPGATACMLSRRFNGVLFASLLVGVLGTSGAVVAAVNPPLSKHPSGPVLVLALFLIFIAIWGTRKLFRPRVAAMATESASTAHAHDHTHSH